ncbi:MAG TPA: response regulator [Arenimonas sp.]|nr:response regulator [Arenimonas sp.]
MTARAPRLVLLSFALLALIMEVALVAYWNTLLEPRLRAEAQAQAQVLAQAQVAGIAQALALDDADSRALHLDEAIDGLLLLRDPKRDEPYFERLQLRIDYEALEAEVGTLDRDEGEASHSAFQVRVPLYHPLHAQLIGSVELAVGSGFYRAFSSDVRWQLVGQGAFIATLLALLGGALAYLLHKLEQQQLARRAAEQALAANERQLQHLIDNLDRYFVYGRDAEGRIVRVSDSVQRVLGLAPEALLRDGAALLTDEPVNIASLQRLKQPREGGSQQFEFELRAADGAIHRLECTEVAVRDRSGRIVAIDGIARDVSEQRRIEAELREARDQAEAASRSKSQFLANMSHEIRTPMNAVIGMATLLARSPLTSRQRGQLAQLQASARMLLGIIDDILDLSRIEAGRLSIVSRDFSLDDLLTDLTSLVGQRARDKQLDVLIDCDPAIPDRLIGDPMRLQQVLVNLVVNAIKFTERGAVVIEIGCLAREHDALLLRFAVRDSGIGIPAEALPRLFEQFTQMDESDTRKHGGAGLGLAISKRLVSLMGGELSAESEPGRGSTFHFEARLGLAGSIAEPVHSPLRAGLRALVVDDSAAARDIFGNLLESMRFDVSLADNAEQAVQLVQQAQPPFDLLLIDYRLPGCDGLHAVRELRRRRRLPASVMITAYADEDLASEAERSGVDVFLQKPVSPSALHDAAVAALQRREGAHVPEHKHDAVQSLRFQSGQRVLVAEDNEVNREVAGELLTGLGLKVMMAEDGLVALRMLREQDFDLVLMDVQMPELDGVEATRRIKQDPALARVPVVALTAHALDSDRERFLAAGMDDFLPKPIDEPALLRVLSRWLQTVASETRDAREPALPAGVRLNLPGIDVEAALARVNGKWPLLLRLLETFRSRHQDAAERARALLDQGDSAAVAALAHTLKGAAATLGASHVEATAKALEQAVRANADAQAPLQQLQQALAALPTAAAELMDLADPPASRVDVPGLLQQLQDAVQERRFDAIALADSLLQNLPRAVREEECGHALAAAVARLDLPAVAAALAAIDVRLRAGGQTP